MQRYFPEPYRFIPPFRGLFWARLAGRLMPRHLRKKMGVHRFHFTGLDHLRASLAQRAGILLTPNHSRWADPMVLGVMGTSIRQYLYYVASYHLFRQGRLMGWLLNRIGGYSIWREGADRESLRETTRILTEAERPVVLFPEGTWFRQNDRVGPLQEGLALITRQAARACTRPLLVHPVGVKYWCLADPTAEIDRRLEALESRLGWRPGDKLGPVARIDRLGGALLGLKEIELLGATQPGDLDARIRRLVEGQVEKLERQHLGKPFSGWPLERIRRLRQLLTRRLIDTAGEEVKADLDLLLFCENLNAQSLDYLREAPTAERLCETVLRIEEILTDAVEVPIVPMGAAVHVGAAIDAREADGLVAQLRPAMQAQVDHLLAQGPPPAWPCPTPRSAVAPPSHPRKLG